MELFLNKNTFERLCLAAHFVCAASNQFFFCDYYPFRHLCMLGALTHIHFFSSFLLLSFTSDLHRDKVTMSSASKEEIFISSISHCENSLVYPNKGGLRQKHLPIFKKTQSSFPTSLHGFKLFNHLPSIFLNRGHSSIFVHSSTCLGTLMDNCFDSNSDKYNSWDQEIKRLRLVFLKKILPSLIYLKWDNQSGKNNSLILLRADQITGGVDWAALSTAIISFLWIQ